MREVRGQKINVVSSAHIKRARVVDGYAEKLTTKTASNYWTNGMILGMQWYFGVSPA